jgi:hypothetical protein
VEADRTVRIRMKATKEAERTLASQARAIDMIGRGFSTAALDMVRQYETTLAAMAPKVQDILPPIPTHALAMTVQETLRPLHDGVLASIGLAARATGDQARRSIGLAASAIGKDFVDSIQKSFAGMGIGLAEKMKVASLAGLGDLSFVGSQTFADMVRPRRIAEYEFPTDIFTAEIRREVAIEQAARTTAEASIELVTITRAREEERLRGKRSKSFRDWTTWTFAAIGAAWVLRQVIEKLIL